ncbi:MAG: hypothetical protein JXB20_03370 [Bacilli bacterium]|nr:hypothetical protein [Bacilli bacterium]MBN2696765.1 hypothetical protein [Bacilli bacterium]
MKRKVLGIMLFFGLLPMLFACQQQTTTTTVAQLEAGQIVFELYDADNVMVDRTVVEHEQEDTLFGLLRETYTVYCQGSDGSPDSSCSFEGQYGYYIMGIDTITAFEGNVYIAFYINGEYALTGIDSTPITDQYVYQFKLETF